MSSRRTLILLCASASFIAASGCSKQPVRTVSSHPPASELICSNEPAAPTEEQINADQFGDIERGFTLALLGWGRECKDALVRNCQWHKARGAIVECVPAPSGHRH